MKNYKKRCENINESNRQCKMYCLNNESFCRIHKSNLKRKRTQYTITNDDSYDNLIMNKKIKLDQITNELNTILHQTNEINKNVKHTLKQCNRLYCMYSVCIIFTLIYLFINKIYPIYCVNYLEKCCSYINYNINTLIDNIKQNLIVLNECIFTNSQIYYNLIMSRAFIVIESIKSDLSSYYTHYYKNVPTYFTYTL